MKGKTLSKATLSRLPLYLQFVRAVQTERISSAVIARRLGLGEVQVRKDLASVCTAGSPKVGYPASQLLEDLEKVLGIRQSEKVVIVGAGKLGQALLEYDGFRDLGFEIMAVFDQDSGLQNEIRTSIPLMAMTEMPSYCQMNGISMGILAVSSGNAQAAADQMADSGIKAMLNCTSCRVQVPETMMVYQNSIPLSLAYLKAMAYSSNQMEED